MGGEEGKSEKWAHTHTHWGRKAPQLSPQHCPVCVFQYMMRMPPASQVRSAVGANDFAPASADHPAPMRFSVAARGEEAPRGMRVRRGGGKRHVR